MRDVLGLNVPLLANVVLFHVALNLLAKAFQFFVLLHEFFLLGLVHRDHLESNLDLLFFAKFYFP